MRHKASWRLLAMPHWLSGADRRGMAPHLDSNCFANAFHPQINPAQAVKPIPGRAFSE
jgi:hypothetical protein